MSIDFLKRVFLVFTSKEKYQISIVFVLSIFTSIFEMIGVFSIVPFMSLLTNPDYITNNEYFSYFAASYSLNLIDSKVYFGIIIIILFVFSNLMNVVTLWYTMHFIAEYQTRISSTVFKKYLSNSYDFFIKSDHAILSKNILDESCVLADGVIYCILQIFTKSLIIVAISILMITVNPKLFFGSIFLFAVIYLLIFGKYKKVLFDIGFNRVEANESRYKKTREVLSNIKDVKYHSLENFYTDSFSNSSYNFAHLNAKRNLIGILPRYFIEIFTFGGVFALILYFLSVSDNFLEYIPTISMFLFAIYRIMPQLQNIFTNTTNIKSSEYVFKNIESILNMDMISRKNTTPIENFNKSISFQNVTFSYDGNSNILENIDLDIKKGQSYAIIGKTGTGKTTLIDSLLGFHKIKSGKIKLDEYDIKDNSFNFVNSIIGYVSQNISYVGDNILKNIVFGGDDNIKLEEVKKIITVVDLEDVVSGLKNGIYENIGDMGSSLSGGQKQRIGIARALYRNPKILILDEATSSLDEKTERKIFQNIKDNYPDITILIITHRNGIISECDEIIEVDNKKVNIKKKHD